MGENRIKQLRQAHNMSQEQLAVIADCNVATISRYESGITKKLNKEILQNLSDFFGVSIDHIMKKPDEGAEVIENIPVVETILPNNQRVIDYYKSSIELSERVKKGLNKFFYRVPDDALSPVLEENDLVMIDEEIKIYDGAIVLIMVKYGNINETYLRFIRFDSFTDTAALLPYNIKKYPPVILTEDISYQLIGVAESYNKDFMHKNNED